MGQGSDEVLRGLLGLQARMYRLFGEQGSSSEGGSEPVSSRWAPPVDIYETEEALVLVAEIPGLDREEIDLEITEDLLVVRGERPVPTSDPQLSYYRVERPNGIFQRSFQLPAGVDPAGATATCKDGVLRITVPKRGNAKAQTIAVKVED